MTILLTIVLAVVTASLAINAAYIVHELGWFPHTKDRSSAANRAFPFRSRYEKDVLITHSFQVMDPNTEVLRKFGHPDVYRFKDPHEALRNVIRRYEESPTRARYDDLVHLSNYIANKVKYDAQIDELISRIHVLMHAMPMKGGK